MIDYVTEDFAEKFLAAYKDRSEDDLFLALANSLRHRDDLEQPLKGIKDDLEQLLDKTKTIYDNVKDQFCDKYCKIEKTHSIQITLESAYAQKGNFTFLANIVGRVVDQIGFIKSSDLQQDTVIVAILSLLILIKSGHKAICEYCNCP